MSLLKPESKEESIQNLRLGNLQELKDRATERLIKAGLHSGFINSVGYYPRNTNYTKEEEQQPQESPTETTQESPPKQTQESPVETPPVKDQEKNEGIFDTEPTDKAQNSTAQAFFDYLEKAQNRVENREDTAYQRAVADMRKAGINPNLLGAINPAESKGVYAQGITATGNLTATNMQDITKRIMQDLDHIFEQGEHAKELAKDYILGILGDASKLGISWLSGILLGK